nr:MAG TPA: minor capsid protein [Caudoviricetes sp.]
MKVADVTVEQLHDYNDKLSAVRSEAGNYFKKLARAEDLMKLGEEARKKAIYHAAVDAVNSFTDAAGSAACDFFDAHVTDARPSSIAPQPWFIKRRLYENIEKYAKTHKLGDDEFMRLLAEEVGGEVVQHANRTTIHNAVKNNLCYARVPFGNSCAFCLMLASRGFVYKTETTAGEDKGHYHARCRCKIVAGKKDTKIGDHNPEKLNQRMMQIAKELDITNFNWEDYISDKTMQDLLQREIRLRDENWLLTGKVPEPTYASEKIKKSVTIDNPWENRTALRLAQHGYKTDFIVDSKVIIENGIKRRIGLPDFESGVEIKTITTSNGAYGAVENHLRKSEKKHGLKRVVIDNSESKLTDDDVIASIHKLKDTFDVPSIAVLTKDTGLKIIK